MKQSKKNKLPLAIQTVRALTKTMLEDVGGGYGTQTCSSLQTIIISKCADSNGCGG